VLLLDRVHLQLLFGPSAALLGRDNAIAERRSRAVPEALAGIFPHGSQRVLRVLLGLILVEERHDLAHHHAHRVLAEILRDRDQPHAVLRQAADIELKLELVSEEARERVDYDRVEGGGPRGRSVHHLLELGASIVGRRRAGLDVLAHGLVTPSLAVGLRLAALIGYRQVLLGLPSGRDAEIEDGALSRRRTGLGRRGHAGSPSGLGNGTEQFVEQLAEMSFDDVQLGFGDGDAGRPVIHDAGMPVLTPASPDRRRPSPWTGQVVVKIDHNPVADARSWSCSGVPHAVIVRVRIASARPSTAASCCSAVAAADGTALIARPSAQACDKGWID